MFKKNIAPIFALILIIFFFIEPEIVRTGAINGIYLWYKKILPFLFPMFILTNILLQYNMLYDMLKKISKFSKKLFGSTFAVIPYIIAFISGYPSGATAIDAMAKSKTISNDEANYLLSFTNICSFQFISAVVAISMLNDHSLALYIAFPHFFGAFVLSQFLKSNLKNNFSNNNKTNNNHKNGYFTTQVTFNQAFSNAITKSIVSILTVCGVIIIFSIITQYLLSILNTSSQTPVAEILTGLFVGILEITNGCNIISLSTLPIEVKLILINFLISFSGFSIIFQTITVVNNFDINLVNYLKYKLVFGIISSFITVILLILL